MAGWLKPQTFMGVEVGMDCAVAFYWCTNSYWVLEILSTFLDPALLFTDPAQGPCKSLHLNFVCDQTWWSWHGFLAQNEREQYPPGVIDLPSMQIISSISLVTRPGGKAEAACLTFSFDFVDSGSIEKQSISPINLSNSTNICFSMGWSKSMQETAIFKAF